MLPPSKPTHWILIMFRICYKHAKHVLERKSLQSTTINIQYFCCYKCECAFVPSPTWWDTKLWFLPTLFSDGFHVRRCWGLQSTTVDIQYGCGYKCECIFVPSPTWGRQILIPYFYPTYYQMSWMFWNATAFNQPLSTFNTAKVEDVSVYLCGVQLWWETGFWFPTSTQLTIRWVRCSAMHLPSINRYHHSILSRLRMWEHVFAESNLMRRQFLIIFYTTRLVCRCHGCSTVLRPSIRTFVISETIGHTPETMGHTQMLMTCFCSPDAVTQISRQVHLDRGVLLQLVLRTNEWTNIRIRKCVFCGGGREMRSIQYRIIGR